MWWRCAARWRSRTSPRPSNSFHLFRAKRFDFVQTHTPKPSLLGLPAARLSHTPSIYTIHGSLYFKGNGRLANVAGWCFERWCCTWATRVVVQSREDEIVLPKVRICSAKKLSLVGNGIATAHFAARVEPATLPGPRPRRERGPACRRGTGGPHGQPAGAREGLP